MLTAVEAALKVFRNKQSWAALVKRCMAEDFSWERSAKEYVGLYKKAIAKHEPH
jgi:starch synthase